MIFLLKNHVEDHTGGHVNSCAQPGVKPWYVRGPYTACRLERSVCNLQPMICPPFENRCHKSSTPVAGENAPILFVILGRSLLEAPAAKEVLVCQDRLLSRFKAFQQFQNTLYRDNKLFHWWGRAQDSSRYRIWAKQPIINHILDFYCAQPWERQGCFCRKTDWNWNCSFCIFAFWQCSVVNLLLCLRGGEPTWSCREFWRKENIFFFI